MNGTFKADVEMHIVVCFGAYNALNLEVPEHDAAFCSSIVFDPQSHYFTLG